MMKTKENLQKMRSDKKGEDMTTTIPYSDHKAKEIRFQNVLEVVAYLKDAGYKVEKSKAYNDRHLMKPDRDGFLQSNVDKYAKAFLERFDGTSGDGNSDKAREEARLTKARADKVEFENDILKGKYVLRSEVEQKHTAKAAQLLTGFENFIFGKGERIVEVAGGDMAKLHDVQELILKEFQGLLREYAKKVRFSVPVKRMEEIEEMRGEE